MKSMSLVKKVVSLKGFYFFTSLVILKIKNTFSVQMLKNTILHQYEFEKIKCLNLNLKIMFSIEKKNHIVCPNLESHHQSESCPVETPDPPETSSSNAENVV